MKRLRVSPRFLQMVSGAVLDQALLSIGSFVVGLLLIRHTVDREYGYYILVSNALLLLTSLQNSFIGPAVVTRITRLDAAEHQGLFGALYHEQARWLLAMAGIATLAVLLLWSLGVLDRISAPLLLAALFAGSALYYREYARILLLAARRPLEVLRADVPYVLLMILGAGLAAFSPLPAVTAILMLGLAAAFGGRQLYGRLQHRQWSAPARLGLLREIAPLGLWSVGGAAIHWTFSQGYSYVVAGVLDVTAVAAIAATRLLMMPVNLLSTGIRSLMLPLTAGWVHHHNVAYALRRLLLFALALAAAALGYFAVMWWMRDWIFEAVMHKHFGDRDRLLMMWSLIFLLMVMRDQLLTLLIARERFRTLTALTGVSAACSLAASYWAMLHYGPIGALTGMLLGELVNIGGVILLVRRELRSAGDEPLALPTAS